MYAVQPQKLAPAAADASRGWYKKAVVPTRPSPPSAAVGSGSTSTATYGLFGECAQTMAAVVMESTGAALTAVAAAILWASSATQNINDGYLAAQAQLERRVHSSE
jgi:hypothetical protein